VLLQVERIKERVEEKEGRGRRDKEVKEMLHWQYIVG